MTGLGLFLSLESGHTQTNCVSPLNDTEYSRYTVTEYAEYVQTNASGPVLDGSNAFYFEALITLKTNLSVSSASLTIPTQGEQPMDALTGARFEIEAGTNSFANLSAAFPGGDYVFTLPDGATTVNLPVGSALPNAPTLVNYTAAQSIDSTRDFTLTWSPLTGGVAKDFISVNVRGALSSSEYGCPEALNGTSDSFVIPAGTLSPSQTYPTSITFVKVLTLDTNSTPAVALLAGTEAITQLSIATSAARSDLGFTNLMGLPGGGVQFDLTTTPGSTYEIQFNPSLSDAAGWTDLLVTNAVTNIVTFSNSQPSAAGFYRAAVE